MRAPCLALPCSLRAPQATPPRQADSIANAKRTGGHLCWSDCSALVITSSLKIDLIMVQTSKFEWIVVRGSALRYCAQLHLHARRASSAVTAPISSEQERRHLPQQFKRTDEATKNSANLIAWRRSTLVLLLLAGVVTSV